MKRSKTADKATPVVDEGLTLPYFTKDQIGDKRAFTNDGFLLCRDVPIARAGTMLYGEGESPIDVGPDGLARVSRSKEELLAPESIASFNGKPVTNEHPPEREVTPATARKYQVGTVLSPRAGEGEFHDCIVADLLITDRKTMDEVNEENPQKRKREVSSGYEAEYVQDEPGKGRQTDIRGNHVALVKRGRCGPRCAINDHATNKEPDMATRVKVNDKRTRVALAPHVKKAVADATTAALEAMGLGGEDDGDGDGSPADMGDDGTGGGTHLHVHLDSNGKVTSPAIGTDDDEPDAGGAGGGADATGGGDLAQRVANLETAMQTIGDQVGQLLALAQGGAGGAGDAGAGGDGDADDVTQDDAGGDGNGDADGGQADGDDDPTKVADAAAKGKKGTPTADSAALKTSYQELLSQCEILWPGFKMPTFDAKVARAKTIDVMCAARRKSLGMFYSTQGGQRIVNSVQGLAADAEVDLETLACPQLAQLFTAAVGAQRVINTNKVTDSARTTPAKPTGNFKVVGKTADTNANKPHGPKSIAELNAMNAEFYAKQNAAR